MPADSCNKRSTTIIGAGVVGLSTALWLQKKGMDVVLVDPAPPLPGMSFRNATSFGNAATVAPSGIFPTAAPGILFKVPGMLMRRDGPLTLYWRDLLNLAPWLVAFLTASLRRRQNGAILALGSLMRILDDGHGPLLDEVKDLRMGRGRGSIHLYRSRDEVQAALRANERRMAEGVEACYLTRDDIAELEPNLAPGYIGGTIFPGCFVIDDPEAYCRGLAQAIQKRGGRFVTARATRIESGADGVHLHTDDGHLATSNQLVIAAGAWSRSLAKQAGDRLNMNTERGYHVAFAPQKGLLTHPVMYPADGFFLTPLSHQIRAAGTVDLGGLDKPARSSRLATLEAKARKMLPGLGARQDTWLGFRPSTPDSLPFIGPSPKDPRIIYACGHGHMGLTLAGITGKLVAELIVGEKPQIDLAPFSPTRAMLRLN